ncbi:MAG: caspase family protein [Paucibacter sp.]|nr:caspase family protein [Roseateles sp.]
MLSYSSLAVVRLLSTSLLVVTFGLTGRVSDAAFVDPPIKPGRHALVIGNENHLQLSSLPSAKEDALRVSKELRAIGFNVMPVHVMESAEDFYSKVLPDFRQRLREGDLVVVYFSGHGFSYGADNFLAPLDLPKVMSRNELADRAVSIEGIQSALAKHKPGALLLLIDACRNVAGFVVNEAGSSGLVPAAMNPSTQSVAPKINLVGGFAARPGTLAMGSSEPGKLSLFTNALASRLATVNEEFGTVFKDVIVDVRASSNDEQEPGLVLFSQTELFLSTDASRDADELVAWKVASSSGSWDAVHRFLRRHALSIYADAARRWLAKNPAEIVAISDVSPLAMEKAWQQVSPQIVKQTGSNLALPAKVDIAAIRAYAATGETRFEVLDTKSDNGPSAQLARLLEHRQAVTTTEVTARTGPSLTAEPIARVPAGTAVIVRDAQRRTENGSAWLEVQLAPSGQRGYLPLSTGPKNAMSSVSVGTGLLEVIAKPIAGRIPDLIEDQPINEALALLASVGKSVLRVSIATAAGAATETERLDRLSRLNHATYLLRRGGVSADRITAVADVPDLEGSGVRIRFFGQ